jgi:hypothetical protein
MNNLSAHNWRITSLVILGSIAIWGIFAFFVFPPLSTCTPEVAERLEPFYVLYSLFGVILVISFLYCLYREKKLERNERNI